MSSWAESLAVFDLETTGVDVRTARIVTAHVGLIDASGTLVAHRDWLADPGVEIPEQATAVHGVTTERARTEGRPAPEVVAEILTSLRGYLDRGTPVVIYNAPYDLSLLAHEARRYGLAPLEQPSPIIDPLVIDKCVDRYRKGKRTLVLAAEHYEVELEGAHDAMADAVAAGRVAQAIARAYPAELGITAAELHELQVGWCSEQSASFQEYMRRVKDPAFVSDGAWPVRG
ncbi:3'-5' exonuclease [Homoserinibacter sp. YIM 151385]|uniref:3'-5' exonuclease n=1 Tax=Homoserinibacter sp. YIM 151385 TaxID=2985506 RepID=UPI0022F0C63A|nr:3'-5' exonuclease [Homoserinibacter sp. YIM 151385]WBU38577.1 3'-5' exonuclease [Homoserinibacter sp. YIM 151385]